MFLKCKFEVWENEFFYYCLLPFFCEQSEKKAIKNLSNKKSSVSETQRQLIFENAKTFPDNTQISFAFIKKDGDIIFFKFNV